MPVPEGGGGGGTYDFLDFVVVHKTNLYLSHNRLRLNVGSNAKGYRGQRLDRSLFHNRFRILPSVLRSQKRHFLVEASPALKEM